MSKQIPLPLDLRADPSKHFFTGVPCARGHLGYRRKVDSACVECSRENARRWKASHSERNKEITRVWREANADKLFEDKRRWRAENIVRAKNSTSRFHEQNPTFRVESEARRRALKRSGLCLCCTRDEIRREYQKAANEGMTVDHIIPLIDGGPHCRHNMQILTLSANSAKGTKYGPKELMRYFYNLSVAKA